MNVIEKSKEKNFEFILGTTKKLSTLAYKVSYSRKYILFKKYIQKIKRRINRGHAVLP